MHPLPSSNNQSVLRSSIFSLRFALVSTHRFRHIRAQMGARDKGERPAHTSCRMVVRQHNIPMLYKCAFISKFQFWEITTGEGFPLGATEPVVKTEPENRVSARGCERSRATPSWSVFHQGGRPGRQRDRWLAIGPKGVYH